MCVNSYKISLLFIDIIDNRCLYLLIIEASSVLVIVKSNSIPFKGKCWQIWLCHLS